MSVAAVRGRRSRVMAGAVCAYVMMVSTWTAWAVPSVAPQHAWTDQFGTSTMDIGMAAAATSAGAFVAGFTFGTIPGQSSAGESDAFVRRYAPNGGISWTRQFGTAGYDGASGVAVTSSAVFLAGATGGTLAGNSAGGSDGYVRRYSADGVLAWTRQFGSAVEDDVRGIAVGGSRIYVVGATEGTFTGQSSAGGPDAFVRAYDLQGTHLWTHQFGSNAPDQADAVAATASGVYVAGSTDGVLPGQSSNGGIDGFVRRYDDQGNIVWTRQLGTASPDRATAVSTASSDLYVGGYTAGAFADQTPKGGYDAFIRRYSTGGAAGWTRQLGGAGLDELKSLSANSGGVYAAGTVADTTLYGRPSAGGADGFVARYTRAGAVVWARQIGTASSESARGVAASPSGVFVTGNTDGTFGGETNYGNIDSFVRRYVSYRPDAEVSTSSTSGHIGNDIYNTSGAGQTRSARVARGMAKAFFVRATNDGDTTDNFAFDGCGSTTRFPVTYYRGSTNITAKVVDGSYRVANVAPGASVTIRAVIKVASAASPGDVRTCGVITSSVRQPALTDVARAKVEAKA